MRKWMWILLGVVFLLISSIAYVWIDMDNSEREEVPLDQLLIKEPILPKEWKNGYGDLHRSNWDKKESFIVKEGITKRGSSHNKLFFWNDKRDKHRNTTISIHVYVYNSPWEAKWSYEWWRPERVEFFMPNTKEEELYPENFPYESPFADDQKVLCAAGEFDGCVNWIYWAGQIWSVFG